MLAYLRENTFVFTHTDGHLSKYTTTARTKIGNNAIKTHNSIKTNVSNAKKITKRM